MYACWEEEASEGGRGTSRMCTLQSKQDNTRVLRARVRVLESVIEKKNEFVGLN